MLFMLLMKDLLIFKELNALLSLLENLVNLYAKIVCKFVQFLYEKISLMKQKNSVPF